MEPNSYLIRLPPFSGENEAMKASCGRVWFLSVSDSANSYQGMAVETPGQSRWRRVWVKTDPAINAVPVIIKNDQKTQHEWNQLCAKPCTSIVC